MAKEDLSVVSKSISDVIKKEISNAARQIEVTIELQHYFATGELPTVNTERHGWPISPDFAIYLVQLLEANDYDLIIEFGSGVSTVVIAKTLAKMSQRRSERFGTKFVSFEHLKQYYDQTKTQLKSAGVDDWVQLHLAPLEPYRPANGNVYDYYACHQSLADLAETFQDPHKKLLVVVDGPPGSTCPHARYPALPIVLNFFKQNPVHILLDDYFREDEKQIAKMWVNELKKYNYQVEVKSKKLEKDACLIIGVIK